MLNRNPRLRAPHLVSTTNVEEHNQAKKLLVRPPYFSQVHTHKIDRLTSQSHAFSPKNLLEQEDIILRYVNMLMAAMAEESCKGPLDLKQWYNWVTFDGT